jgi:hypothetical protein
MLTRILSINAFARGSNRSGKSYSHARTFWKVRYSVAPRKGGLPAIIWNKMQPNAQISDLTIMWGKSIELNWYHYSRYCRTYCILACSFRSTSGDTYSAVPTNDRFLPSAVRKTAVISFMKQLLGYAHRTDLQAARPAQG